MRVRALRLNRDLNKGKVENRVVCVTLREPIKRAAPVHGGKACPLYNTLATSWASDGHTFVRLCRSND